MNMTTGGMSQEKDGAFVDIISSRTGRSVKPVKSAPPAYFMGNPGALIAHEVKNPLASICINVEMLASYFKSIPDVKERKEAVEIAQSVLREVERLGSIACRFLSDGSVREVRPCLQSLSDMLLELQLFMKKEMESRNIEFVNEFPEELPKVCFDKEPMREVFLNLYENAADAMPNGGKIRSRARLSGEWMEMQVSDTGYGISDADAERLFDPFFTTKETGAGLGLPIVEDILKAGASDSGRYSEGSRRHGGVQIRPRERDGFPSQVADCAMTVYSILNT
jgi:C4-dicarboxylate-specific signal transduction histidine kinase